MFFLNCNLEWACDKQKTEDTWKHRYLTKVVQFQIVQFKKNQAILYSDNQKSLEEKDDFQAVFMTLNSPICMGYSNYAVLTDPFHLICDLISV